MKKIPLGAVLCGGESRRMGHDKALIRFRGAPLVQHAVKRLDTLCEKVVLSAPKEKYLFLNNEHIPDQIQGIGPLGGIYSVFRQTGAQALFVLSCDMPLISNAVLQKLWQSLPGFQAAVARSAGKNEPLCAAYSCEICPLLEEQIAQKDYKLQHVLQKARTNFVDFSDSTLFFNANSPEDIQKLSRLGF